jgi:omega-amidase
VSSLSLRLIQSATHWHDAAANRDHFESLLTHDANEPPADVYVLPEMFTTGFTMDSQGQAETMSGPTVDWMRRQAQALNAAVVGSVIIQDGGYFNRLIWAEPDGQVHHYDKRHLFRMAGEHEHFSAGEQRKIVTFRGWRLCLSVCYDLRFPVWLRNRDDYDALLCVANWPAARASAWQTLLRARAIENQAYCVGVNIVGVNGAGLAHAGGSGIYAPDGAVCVEAGDQAVVVQGKLDREVLTDLRQSFPVSLDADSFLLTQ